MLANSGVRHESGRGPRQAAFQTDGFARASMGSAFEFSVDRALRPVVDDWRRTVPSSAGTVGCEVSSRAIARAHMPGVRPAQRWPRPRAKAAPRLAGRIRLADPRPASVRSRCRLGRRLDRHALAAAAGVGLVRIVEHELRRQLGGLVVDLVPIRNSTALGSIRMVTPLSSTTSSSGSFSAAYSKTYSEPAQPPFFTPTRRPHRAYRPGP
jgi:hypothetical protein